MGDIFLVGSLSTNSDPLMRKNVFVALPAAFSSLGEAVEAAKTHYAANYGRGGLPRFRVYESTDPEGTKHVLVEVSDDSGPLVTTGMYKIIQGQWADRTTPAGPRR